MGLRVYTAHLPSPPDGQSFPVLVREGFSWGACLFGVLWALWHRLWIEAAALLALFLALGVIVDYLDPGESLETIIMLAVVVLIGFSANDWRRQSLDRRGYVPAGVVTGANADEALRRFLDRWQQSPRKPTDAIDAARQTMAWSPQPLPGDPRYGVERDGSGR